MHGMGTEARRADAVWVGLIVAMGTVGLAGQADAQAHDFDLTGTTGLAVITRSLIHT